MVYKTVFFVVVFVAHKVVSNTLYQAENICPETSRTGEILFSPQQSFGSGFRLVTLDETTKFFFALWMKQFNTSLLFLVGAEGLLMPSLALSSQI